MKLSRRAAVVATTVAIGVAALALLSIVFAEGPFTLPWANQSSLGGGSSESENYTLDGSVVRAAGEADSENFGVSGGFWPGVQALRSSGPANPVPSITQIDPSTATEGDPEFTLTITGNDFVESSAVMWDSIPRSTTFVSANGLTAQIGAADVASAGDGIATVVVTVRNPIPGGGESNGVPFTIVSPAVDDVDTDTSQPGGDANVSAAPTGPGEAGVTATLSNNTGGSDDATVTAANFSEDPNQTGIINVGGGFVDVQVAGVDDTDSLQSTFYYPTSITGGVEADLALLYYTGTDWARVLSSGGADPIKDTADNQDGTVSGGSFAVTFDNSSTPRLTDLTGTVMTMTTPPEACGDLDGNLRVDVNDAVVLLKILVQLITPTQTQMVFGDVQRDGELDISDALRVLQHVVDILAIDGCGPG